MEVWTAAVGLFHLLVFLTRSWTPPFSEGWTPKAFNGEKPR